MDAAAQLSAWRKAKNLTLFQIATKIGCDPSTLNKLERRRRRPGADLRDAIERVTGIKHKLWTAVQMRVGKASPTKPAKAAKAAKVRPRRVKRAA